MLYYIKIHLYRKLYCKNLRICLHCFGDCGTSLPLIDGEVERVLAVLTLVNQPDVQTIAIGVDAEFVCAYFKKIKRRLISSR